jgi:hypothetical protein
VRELWGGAILPSFRPVNCSGEQLRHVLRSLYPRTKPRLFNDLAVKVVPRASSAVFVHVPLQAPLQPVASANTGVGEGTSTGQEAPFVLRCVLRWLTIPVDHQPRERGSGQAKWLRRSTTDLRRSSRLLALSW